MSQLSKTITLVLGLWVAQTAHAVEFYKPVEATSIHEVENVSPAPKKTTTTKWSVGFGLPELLFGKMSRPLGRRFSLGVGVGALPAMPFAHELQTPTHSGFSEDYQISFQPSANLYMFQTDLEYRLNHVSSLKFATQFLYVNVGGDSLVRDTSTGRSTMLGSLQIYAVQPILNLAYQHNLISSASGSLVGSIGLNVMLKPMISSSLQGSLPSYSTLSPGTQEALSDGLGQARASAEQKIAEMLSKYPILPALSLGWSWR